MPKEPRDTSDWIDIRGDGGVLKHVLREGNKAAGHPIDGWCCKVNFDAYIEGGWFDGRQVETTRDRPEEDGDYMFLLGDTHEAVKDGWCIKGLNYGAETMHRGEKAEFIFKPEYAYGAKGSKSHPKVPPNATLYYVVELLTWKPALSDEKNMLDQTWWERFELAYALKESAADHFREGQPEEAREKYWKCGMLMDVIGQKGTDIAMPEERLAEQNALALTSWLNEAMCYIKLAQNEEDTGRNYKGHPTGSSTSPHLWRKAIDSCEVALKYDSKSVKGHYRLGLAYAHLHEFDSAREHYQIALKGNPQSKEIRIAYEALKQAHKVATEEDASMYKKILRKSKGLYEAPVLLADISDSAKTTMQAYNPRVYLTFSIDGQRTGKVEIELFHDKLPRTAENFRSLCAGDSSSLHPITRRPKHYKGCPMHRIVKGLCVQGGDYICGDGRGGASIYGNYFADEGFETKHDRPGLLSMANTGRDTNRSQFFITIAPAPHLDGRHVVFGQVVSGMEVVHLLEAVPVEEKSEKPRLPILIEECGVVGA